MERVFIIAEAGVNHNGSIRQAEQLVDKAVEAGADAVKFQAFKAEELACHYAPKADYQVRNTLENDSQFDMLKQLELDGQGHRHLIDYCNQKKIRFLSSPFGFSSIKLLDSLNLRTFKIPSGEITNLPYLENIGRLGKKLILSTGMANLKEIRSAIDILTDAGTPKKNLSLLHCCTQYPAPFGDVNLLAIPAMINSFPGIRVGYSDHTLGIEAAIAAVALGARIIEKHFTLDRTLDGPDHIASIEPDEFKRMVLGIRNIEKALGDGVKEPKPAESENINIVRKSIVAARTIKAGEIFTASNLTVKRPGNGLSPMHWHTVIGKKAEKDFLEDEQITI